MAEGIYMGGEVLKGKESKDIRDIFAEIESFQDKFSEQSGKAKLWDMGGDIVQALLNIAMPGAGNAFDLLIDKISRDQLLKKVCDPESDIRNLETAYTGGG